MDFNSQDVKVIVRVDVSLWLLTLWKCRRVEGITYPVIRSSVHGKHDGANFQFVHHFIYKLHAFLVSVFPYAYCTN